MCGRFTLTTTADIVADVFDATPSADFSPRYNIAPTQTVAIVRCAGSGARRTMDPAHWGLIPSWAKDAAIGNRMINARAETVAEKPAYRAAFRRRRCLVPTDGFYEWQRTSDGKKPHWIHRIDGSPFAMAGLWESWKSAEEVVESFTIITVTPNSLMKPIHDRMPAILAPGAYDRWLDPSSDATGELNELLAPFPDGNLEAVAVGTYVNSPRHDDPHCIEPA